MLHAEVKLNMVKSAVQLVHIGILWMRVAPFGIFIEPNFKNHIGWLLFFCICICICIWIVAWTRGSGNKDCQVGRKWKGKRNRTTNIYLGIFCLCASFKHAQSMCILNMTQNIVSHWFVYNRIKKSSNNNNNNNSTIFMKPVYAYVEWDKNRAAKAKTKNRPSVE